MIDLKGNIYSTVSSVTYLEVCQCVTGLEVDFKSGGSIRMLCNSDSKPNFLSALGMKLVSMNFSEQGINFSFLNGDQANSIFVGSESTDLNSSCKLSNQDDNDCSSDSGFDVDHLIERIKFVMSVAV